MPAQYDFVFALDDGFMKRKEDIKTIGSWLANFYCFKAEKKHNSGLTLVNTPSPKHILSLKTLC